MIGTGRPPASTLILAALLVVVGLSPAALALDVSPKAMKVVGSSEYAETNVEAYAGELEDVDHLDGSGGAIAVLDTGVDHDHPTFGNAFVAGAQYFSDCDCIRDQNPITKEMIKPDDSNGHGTHVASIALGRGGSEIGPRGVAPGASLVDVKISNSLGFSVNATAKGVEWVMDYNEGKTNWTANEKVRTIVISFASLEPHDEKSYDVLMKKVRQATEQGILVVAAAGNCGPGSGNVSQGCPSGGAEENRIPSPGATPEALTVGAVDDNGTARRSQDQVAGYSSRGPNPAKNASETKWRKPDVVAPGSNISAACYNVTSTNGEGMDCEKSGTSMSAPHVAGLAMIVWQALEEHGEKAPSPGVVKDMITGTATDMGEAGWDKVSGYGYVDGYEAVVEGTNKAPVSHFDVTPANPKVGEQVVLDASSSEDPDEGDRIERYIWTIDGEEEIRPADQPRVQLVFDEAGSHTVELVTEDSRGQKDPKPRVHTFHVSEAEDDSDDQPKTRAPDAELSYGPTPATVGEEVWFDAGNSSDADGHEIVSYAWEFGAEGSFDADRETDQPSTSWTFEEAGTHEVVVEVTDSSGASAQANVSVEVEEKPTQPPAVEITNPQEGDVVEPGVVNMTWTSRGGPAESFAVSVDQVAVDETTRGFLEVHLNEDDRTLAVKAHGPGGTDVDRVNVSVVEDEEIERQGGASGSGSDDAEPNPPRPSTTGDDSSAESTNASGESGAEGSQTDDEGAEEANDTPGPGLAAVLALLASGLLARRN